MSHDLRRLPPTEELLAEDTDLPPLSQISQEPLQATAYRLRELPPAEELLAEDTDLPPLSQISQEPLQATGYRTRTSE